MEILDVFWNALVALAQKSGFCNITPQQGFMIAVSFLLMYLAIVRKFEPLLLLPIAFGMMLTNIPGANMFHPEMFGISPDPAIAANFAENGVNYGEVLHNGGLLDILYLGVKLQIFPPLIFLGIGCMTDFGPLIANPKSLLLGAAEQLGIFVTFLGACAFSLTGIEGVDFSFKEAASIGIIGGADGPTAIFLTSKLAPQLLGSIAVAAYSYMALVPVIQPPIMKLLTTKKERAIVMEKFMNMYETQDLYVIYSRFLESCGYPGLPHVQLQERKLRYEDVYPVLYMKYRLLRQTSHNGIKHLVVDEMQDYSRLQYLILKMMFPCRMTILGDKAQTMEDEAQDVLGFLPKIFGKEIRRIVMNKSYRNTVEIASYANQLAGITDMDLFDRHGDPVEELFFKGKKQQAMEAALDELVNKLQLGAEQFETAALILRTESEAKEAARILKEKLENTGFDMENRFSYLHRDSTSFCKGLTVTTFYLAKGLEFDQVFSLFPAADQSPIAKQGRYIAATRALHKLHMYEYGK